jgi:DNA-binding SARP family transcriptional activator
VKLSSDAEKLIAFLALHHTPVARSYVAGSLWGETAESRALGNLRSALWRLRSIADGLVDADQQTLTISEATSVDIWGVGTEVRRLQNPSGSGRLPSVDSFTTDLLPGWYDEWVLFEQESHRQTCLHALEQLSSRFEERGQFGPAIQAALASVAIDPLRESSHRQLIRIHVAEGNYSEALRQYRSYEQLIHTELGLAPSPLLVSLVSKDVVAAR